MTDQTQRLEIATVKAEVGSNILSRFSNDAINADGIPTDSGAIPNLKQVIKSIEDKASVSTSIYPTVAAGLAATAEGGMFLVASGDSDEIYEVWRKVSGAAVDTGKRALSSQAAEDAVTAAQASAEAAAAAAGNAAEQFQDIFEADQIEREAEFRALMDASGYESVYLVYGPGVVVSRQTQLVQKDGELYRVTNAADLPLTLTGTWSTDAPKLMAVGDAALRQSIESAEGYDQIGATLPTGVVSTVKGFFNWILDRITLSTSGSASIVAAVAKGGKVVIKNGGHYLHAPAVCDYSVPPLVGFPGHDSKRYDIEGETPGGCIISNQHGDFAFKFMGSYPMTQDFGGFDRIGNMTVTGPVVTSPNVDNSGGAGIQISNKTRTEVYNFNLQNLSLGMELNDVVTSTMRNINVGGCFSGIRGGPTLLVTGPNAMHWTNTRVANTYTNAIQMSVGACLTFDGLTLEGNGTMGYPHVALMLTARPGDLAGVVNVNGLYTELNAGTADVYAYNASTHPVIVNLDGCMMARVAADRYVASHIQANSEGGGRVTVKLGSASSFLHGFGYAPSADRPFWVVGPHCEVIWDESCVFSETTSLVYWLCLNREYSFTIAASGAILAGPEGFACTSLGGGHYTLYRTAGMADFAKFADDVVAQVTPGAGGFTAYVAAKTSSTIDIQLHNGGSAGDAKFDITIKRVKGFYS